MTNSKYIYLLLIFCLAVALFAGLRRTLWSTVDVDDTEIPSTVGASGASSLVQAAPISATTTVTATPGQLSSTKRIPQSGGTFVQVVAQDADTLNPLLTLNPTSRAVLQKIYPVLVDRDPVTGLPTIGRGLATRWELANEGRTITFTLRSGVQWSDGAPVTARDIKFTYDAILDPTVENVYRENFANVNDVRLVEGNDQTLVIELANADCAILQAMNQPILPSHLYATYTAAQLADPNLRPQVSAGPFLLIDWIAGHRITLVRNAIYWEGAPQLDRWEFQIIADPIAQLQALLDGKADWLELTPAQIAPAQAHPELTTYAALADSLTFVALNLANSQNPQAGRSTDGVLITQEAHPILGDLRVRQALAKAVDATQILPEAYGRSGQALGTYILPTIPWAYADDLPPVGYTPTEAQQLLDAAGWRDSDGDGVRDRAGVPLSLSLLTNADSEPRTQLGQLLALQWKAMGVNVRFEALAFDTVVNRLLALQYDMVLIGWDNLGPDPANSDFWHSRYDVPGNGANFVSYQNPQVDTWLDEARTTPTCDPALRGKLYRQVQHQIYQGLPYIMLSGQIKRWAYPSAWQELHPAPWRFDYNAHRWWR